MKLLLLLFLLLSSTALTTAQSDAEWRLIWHDEFDGEGPPSLTRWNYHVGSGWNPGINGFMGWGNDELEWYRPENCTQQDGALVITATYEPEPTAIANRDWHYFSCRITSATRRSLTFGAVEARIRMPNVDGAWPAFWMLGNACGGTSTNNYNAPLDYYDLMADRWASCGEIDIMEHKNADPFTIHNLFWDTRTELLPWATSVSSQSSTHATGDVSEYHVFRLERTPERLTWLVDGKVAKTMNITPANMEEFQRPFYVIFNLALGGRFPGKSPAPESFPITMQVDYVRFYAQHGHHHAV